ncbi:MAG: hypothetical protein Q7U75_09065, partial [Desulfobacterales bacterium]|nr:hypothetical protein [Desulfobacterales bacterium]
DRILRLRIPFIQEFVRRRCRNTETERFWDEGQVLVSTVEPEAAPIAYRVSESGAPAERPPHGASYCIRSFKGSLWWPLIGSRGFVEVGDFVRLAAEGDEGALLAVDPSIETPLDVSPLRPEVYFEQNLWRTMNNSSIGERWARAHIGASRMMFCDDKVYLEAGEPIYYLVHSAVKGAFDVAVGPSAPDRVGTSAVCLPGPGRRTRLECARRGTAFAIGEVDEEIRYLRDRGNSVYGRPKIDAVQCQAPDIAALSCARAMAEFLWSEARRDGYWTDALRRSVPILASTRDPNAATENLPYREVLGQLASAKDMAVRNEFFNEIRDARDVLRRLRSFGHGTLGEEDEAALWSLGTQVLGASGNPATDPTA